MAVFKRHSRKSRIITQLVFERVNIFRRSGKKKIDAFGRKQNRSFESQLEATGLENIAWKKLLWQHIIKVPKLVRPEVSLAVTRQKMVRPGPRWPYTLCHACLAPSGPTRVGGGWSRRLLGLGYCLKRGLKILPNLSPMPPNNINVKLPKIVMYARKSVSDHLLPSRHRLLNFMLEINHKLFINK